MAIEKHEFHTVFDKNGAAVLDVERGWISTFNPTGAFVWQGLQRGESLEDIVASLAVESGADAQLIDRDVRGFLEDLRSQGLMA